MKSITATMAAAIALILGLYLSRHEMAQTTHPPIPTVHTVRFTPRSAVPEFDGYKDWNPINTVPQYIMSPLDMLCTGPSAAQLAEQKKDPHVHHYMLCYVNETGKRAFFGQKHPTFPVGSIIVKEKLDSDSRSAHRSLITGMIKRQSGYDSAHGDWEYVVCNGDVSILQARGRLENCGSCHAKKSNAGFVFRDELGYDRLAALK